jgi:hypothetical protein
MLPLIAIIVCGSAMFLYLTQFEQSLVTPDGIDTDFTRIPNAQLLISLQVLFYVAAELAFILMALREYLQDLLGITDVEQIVPRMRTADEIQHDTLLAEEAALAVHSGRASIEYDHPTDTRLTIKLQNGHQFTVLREPFDARLSSLSISSPRVEMPTTSRSKGTPAIE